MMPARRSMGNDRPGLGGKLVAPVVVVACVVVYYIAVALVLTRFGLPDWVNIAAAIVSVAVTALSIAALVARIRELRSGEEDDLGEY